MSTKLSIEEMLAHLEKREKHHREQEAFHAEQEVFHGEQQVHHREQRAVHVAELEKVRESLATFRVAASSAVDLVGPVEPPAPPPPAPKLPPPGKKFVSGLLRLVVEGPDLKEPFGPAAVAAEANRRFRAHLRVLVDTRTASDVLAAWPGKARSSASRRERPITRRSTSGDDDLHPRAQPRRPGRAEPDRCAVAGFAPASYAIGLRSYKPLGSRADASS